MEIRNLIFDVDGTLWDSAEAVAESWNEVLRKYEGVRTALVTEEEVYSYMGHTMEEIAAMMLPDLPTERRQSIMAECMDYENEYLAEHSGRFYPGVRECFETLRKAGYRIYIVSNCQEGYIETMLKCGGISYRDPFYNKNEGTEDSLVQDLECFGRTMQGKAENIRLLMERNGLKKEECVYIGDTIMDEQASDGAGIPMIHASYGFGKAEHPLFRLPALSDLPALLQNAEREAERK